MSFTLRIPGKVSALAAMVLLAASSIAQTIDNKPEVKAEVLDRVTTLLSTRAYVPGLDFAKWQSFVDSEKSKLDESKNDDEFSYAINEALTKFGASHIYFATPRSGATAGRRTASWVSASPSSGSTKAR